MTSSSGSGLGCSRHDIAVVAATTGALLSNDFPELDESALVAATRVLEPVVTRSILTGVVDWDGADQAGREIARIKSPAPPES